MNTRAVLGATVPAAGAFAGLFAFMAAGGILGIVALLGIAVTICILLSPLVGLILSMLSHLIWLVGAYAPGGIGALSPSKIFSILTFGSTLLLFLRFGIAPTYAPHMLPLAAYGLVVVLAPVLTPGFEDSIVGIGKHAMLFLPYLLVANIAITRRALLAVLASVSIICALAAVIAILEVLFPGVGLSLGEVGFGAHIDETSLKSATIKRVTGGMGDANWFSYTMAAALPLNLIWWRRARGLPLKLFALSLAGLQSIGLVLAYTRTPLVGLAVVALFFVIKRRLPLLPMAAAGALVLVSGPLWMPEGFAERMFSFSYLTSGSTGIRKEITIIATDAIAEKPLFGHGYQRYGPFFMERTDSPEGLEMARRARSGDEPAEFLRAHNLYLDIWVAYGMAGLLPFLVFCVFLFRELAQVEARGSPEYGDIAVILMGSLISFLMSGLGGHAQELKIFWILAGIVAGLRRAAFEPASALQHRQGGLPNSVSNLRNGVTG